MSEHQLTMSSDGGVDDLPRTLRREREAREREREARDRDVRERGFQMPSPATIMGEGHHGMGGPAYPGDLQPAVVRQLDVPFLHMVLFWIKAMFAAIPALMILAVMLWFAGHALMTYFPKLVLTEIVIRVPK